MTDYAMLLEKYQPRRPEVYLERLVEQGYGLREALLLIELGFEPAC